MSTNVLVSICGFIIAPPLLISAYVYYRACCRRTCHACWISAEQCERRGTDRGAVSSVLLPHSCPTARFRRWLLPTAVRTRLLAASQHYPQVVERHAQVKSKQVSAFERKPARLLRIAGEDARDVRDRAVGGGRKVS